MTLLTILLILWCHFLGDFVLQDDDTAKYKSEKLSVLAYHIMFYTMCLVPIGAYITLNRRDPLDMLYFILLNSLAHGIIDYITSRITKYYFLKSGRHAFFVTIGFDQAAHMSILFYTAILFGGHYNGLLGPLR